MKKEFNNAVSISGLDVIGYADKRNLGCIPDFTAPIFRVRGTDMVLSPYKIEDDLTLRAEMLALSVTCQAEAKDRKTSHDHSHSFHGHSRRWSQVLPP